MTPTEVRRAVTSALAELLDPASPGGRADTLPTAVDAAYCLAGCADVTRDTVAAQALDLLVAQLPVASAARHELAALRAG
ncbi:hypothetical protein FTX61_02560 [Nitriliruptoraceae bacterium ZYF776]|nr:hypothetical protein [Profundirhabdus halotolerans]